MTLTRRLARLEAALPPPTWPPAEWEQFLCGVLTTLPEEHRGDAEAAMRQVPRGNNRVELFRVALDALPAGPRAQVVDRFRREREESRHSRQR